MLRPEGFVSNGNDRHPRVQREQRVLHRLHGSHNWQAAHRGRYAIDARRFASLVAPALVMRFPLTRATPSMLLAGIVDCFLALGFEKMDRGSLGSKVRLSADSRGPRPLGAAVARGATNALAAQFARRVTVSCGPNMWRLCVLVEDVSKSRDERTCASRRGARSPRAQRYPIFQYMDRTNPMDKHVLVVDRTFGVTDSPIAPQMFGNAGKEHMRKYGTTVEQLAKIAYKNHKHSGMCLKLEASPQTQNQSTKSTTRLATAGGAFMDEFILEKWGGTPMARHHLT